MRYNTLTLALFLSVVLQAASCLASGKAETTRRTDLVQGAAGNYLTLLGNPIQVGDRAPDFIALDRNLRSVSLHDFAGTVVIVTVFPSIDTHVCAYQTRRFNELASEIPNVKILTVSMDLPFALDRFCAVEGIDEITTLSDHKSASFGLQYGYLIEEMRLLARGTIIIDKQGVVQYVEHVPVLDQEPNFSAAINKALDLVGDPE